MKRDWLASKIWKRILVIFIILGYTSLNQWSSFPLLNSQIERLLQILFLVLACYMVKLCRKWTKYPVIVAFLVWAGIGIIRGIFVADCYWEYNQLTIGMMSLS